jgi:hypothetical protein
MAIVSSDGRAQFGKITTDLVSGYFLDLGWMTDVFFQPLVKEQQVAVVPGDRIPG